MPFLSVAQLWSPFATASGSVALAGSHIIVIWLYYICILCINGCSIHASTISTWWDGLPPLRILGWCRLCGWASARKNMDWCSPSDMVLSHLSPAVSWIVHPYRMVQKWSPLCEFMACPYSVTSALHLRCGTLFLPRPLEYWIATWLYALTYWRLTMLLSWPILVNKLRVSMVS